MKQAYFNQRYAFLKLSIANAKNREEELRKTSKVTEAHNKYKEILRLEKQLDDLIKDNTVVEEVTEGGEVWK